MPSPRPRPIPSRAYVSGLLLITPAILAWAIFNAVHERWSQALFVTIYASLIGWAAIDKYAERRDLRRALSCDPGPNGQRRRQ